MTAEANNNTQAHCSLWLSGTVASYWGSRTTFVSNTPRAVILSFNDPVVVHLESDSMIAAVKIEQTIN